MALDPTNLPEAALAFLAESHLATLTTLRPDGTPHVVPVGFTYDQGDQLVRIITFSHSRKVRNLRAAGEGRAVVAQVDGGRWLALEGMGSVTDDPQRVDEAVRRYAERYRAPGENPERVAIEIQIDRVLGRA